MPCQRFWLVSRPVVLPSGGIGTEILWRYSAQLNKYWKYADVSNVHTRWARSYLLFKVTGVSWHVIACRGHYAEKGTFFSVPLRLPGSTILPKKGLSALSLTMQKSVTRYSTKERAKISDCQQKYLRDQDVRENWWSFDRTFRILQNLRKQSTPKIFHINHFWKIRAIRVTLLGVNGNPSSIKRI